MSLSTNLHTIADWLGIDPLPADCAVTGLSTDSRTISAGQIYVALRGERCDGHDFLPQVSEQGAVAAVVEQHYPQLPLPQLVVNNSRIALGQIARGWYLQHQTPVLAITGSNGKTTVKELCASICRQVAPTLATAGNFNNDIGVPLTLLRLTADDRYAVVEMGANHIGEIAHLTSIVQPNVAILNNASAAHLAGFGSLAGVVKAKGEIFSNLTADGTAIINSDDPNCAIWQQQLQISGHRSIRFGLQHEADVAATWQQHGIKTEVTATTPHGRLSYQLALAGEHNVRNSLAAVAATQALGIPNDAIIAGLEQVTPVPGRLRPLTGTNGASIWDDSYNANPASMLAGMKLLAQQSGTTIAALGDMGELGAESADLHRQVGANAKQLGIDYLFASGKQATNYATGFGSNSFICSDQQQMAQQLAQYLQTTTTVLVKGSRSSHMELLVAALTATEDKS